MGSDLGNLYPDGEYPLDIHIRRLDRIFDLGLLFALMNSINALRQKRKDTIEESTTKGDGVLIEIVIIHRECCWYPRELYV